MFRATETAAFTSTQRRPVQLGLLHRSGNRVARWLCCSGAPCGWALFCLGNWVRKLLAYGSPVQ